MKTLFVVLMLLTVGCSKSPTGPSGQDPTVLITNRLQSDTAFFTWRDGQGVAGSDIILAGHSACEKFTARPDSAYFQIIVNQHATNGNTYVSTLTAPWFDPSVAEGVTVDIALVGASVNIVEHNTSPNLPC